jgi:1-acyl-sn-glycerol-3-phosphate acyltransferase
MKRIALMIVKNLFHIPGWFCKICKMGREDDIHTEQERYDFLRSVIKKANKSGRVTVSVYGAENLPEKDGFVMFPNHQGLFDVLAITEGCSHPFGVVIKKEAANIILVKQIVRLLRGLAIDRSDTRSALVLINRMTEEVKAGRNYIIFPEGTRSRKENEILDFKAGTFKCAVNAKCPIVPVALIDCFKPFDISSIKKETVQVHFLEPILYDQYMGMKTTEIAHLVHDKIQNKINEFK